MLGKLGAISVFNDQIVAMEIKNSLAWHLRNDIERSVAVESKAFIMTLCCSFTDFIKIHYFPFLTLPVVSGGNLNILTFRIGSTFDIKNLTLI